MIKEIRIPEYNYKCGIKILHLMLRGQQQYKEQVAVDTIYWPINFIEELQQVKTHIPTHLHVLSDLS